MMNRILSISTFLYNSPNWPFSLLRWRNFWVSTNQRWVDGIRIFVTHWKGKFKSRIKMKFPLNVAGKVILASTSPRRKQILDQVQIQFEGRDQRTESIWSTFYEIETYVFVDSNVSEAFKLWWIWIDEYWEKDKESRFTGRENCNRKSECSRDWSRRLINR